MFRSILKKVLGKEGKSSESNPRKQPKLSPWEKEVIRILTSLMSKLNITLEWYNLYINLLVLIAL